MGCPFVNLSIICEVERPHLGSVFTVENEGIMDFPHEKIFQEIGLDKVKETSPGLMPFIKGQLKFSVVRKGLRSGSNLTGKGINCQYIICRIKSRLILKKKSFIGKVCKRDMSRPAIYKLLLDIVRDDEGCVCTDQARNTSQSLANWQS